MLTVEGRGEREGGNMELGPSPPSRESCEWHFHYTSRIHGGPRPWPYTHRAWNHFMWWATLIRIRPEHDGETQTTLLEAYLSFICVSQGDRFESGVGADRNGEWLSVQLERFRSGWLSFQALTGAPKILDSTLQKQDAGGWGPRFGLPRLETLNRSLDLPKVEAVWNMIRGIPGAILGMSRASRRADMWRRWAPGNPGSQMVGAGRFQVPKLWEIPRRRYTIKLPPPPVEERHRRHCCLSEEGQPSETSWSLLGGIVAIAV